MKLLIVSDQESKFIEEYFNRAFFDGVEMTISAGDLSPHYLEFIASVLPVPVLYVPGNHDARYSEEPPEGCQSIDGKIVESRGLRIAGLGGCQSQNPDGVYQLSEKQMAKRVNQLLGKAKNSIDIFVSHAPALGLVTEMIFFIKGFPVFTKY